MNDPEASDRGMQRHNTTFTPSPYPSPQGEGIRGNPDASGRGIEKHNNKNSRLLPGIDFTGP